LVSGLGWALVWALELVSVWVLESALELVLAMELTRASGSQPV